MPPGTGSNCVEALRTATQQRAPARAHWAGALKERLRRQAAELVRVRRRRVDLQELVVGVIDLQEAGVGIADLEEAGVRIVELQKARVCRLDLEELGVGGLDLQERLVELVRRLEARRQLVLERGQGAVELLDHDLAGPAAGRARDDAQAQPDVLEGQVRQ